MSTIATPATRHNRIATAEKWPSNVSLTGDRALSSLARLSIGGIMAQSTLKGSCLCGVVKYEVTGEPSRFYHCHCSRCRKVTGTGHASNMFL
jgi:hypothetical protein